MAKYAKTEDGYQKIEELNANKIDKDNPVATGSFSMGREPGSVIGNCSHAEGLYTTASGEYSHAEGNVTTASSYSSHAEGSCTTASGSVSHAEGSNTTASADCSHAEGLSTVASGDYSHAEGSTTIASGKYSHTEGCYTTAVNESQHVQGEFNIVDTTGTASTRGKYAHIVGNGTSSKRSNAHTLDWNGNAWFAGNVYVGGTGQDDTNTQLLATVAMLRSMLPKITTITLGTTWQGAASPYYQDIELACVTETSMVDLQPTPDQLASWQDDGLAFTTAVNEAGVIRVYIAGGKPSEDMTVQVKVQEVVVV